MHGEIRIDISNSLKSLACSEWQHTHLQKEAEMQKEMFTEICKCGKPNEM